MLVNFSNRAESYASFTKFSSRFPDKNTPIGSQDMLANRDRVLKTPRNLFCLNNAFDSNGKEIKPSGIKKLPIGINPKRIVSR